MAEEQQEKRKKQPSIVVFDVAVLRIGEKIVVPKTGKVAEIRGYGFGRDGRLCYLISRGEALIDSFDMWDTALIPVDTVKERVEVVPLSQLI